MQDDAALWATPAIEELTTGNTPFEGSWTQLRQQFKARFETVDEAVDAKECLRILWQGSLTIPEYTACFKELANHTGYSMPDLRDRFYEHLSTTIKDELVHTARPIGTLEELIIATTDIDLRIRQRCAERDRERGKSTGATAAAKAPLTMHTTSFAAPPRDPNAMEVDATRTREEFNRLMRGKCYGCGSSAHVKKDGGHDREVCNYCRRVGHREVVCMDKYLKRPRSQKLAATVEDVEDDQSVASSSSQPTAAGASADVLNKLLDQQRLLAEQIVKLQQSF